MVRWGLIPFWTKQTKIGNKLINTRAESVAVKPAFRAAWKQRRCLVPADANILVAVPVSSSVNNPKNDDRSVIEQIGEILSGSGPI
jgi:putative SOS response-associated peptidase YedK